MEPAMKNFYIALKSTIFASGFILFWGWIFWNVRHLDKLIPVQLPVWLSPIGIIFIILGCLVGLSCIVTFIVRGSGTPAPFDPPVKFVIKGPYKYVRNPMYLGGLMILTGFGLYANSVSILIFSFVWILLANVFVIFFEEKTLRVRFGNDYARYCNEVGRWIPKFNKFQ